MHVKFGSYHVSDVKVVAAFDVDKNKVGLDVADAIFAEINNTIKFSDVPKTDVIVQRGATMDGFAKYYHETVDESPAEVVDVADVLRETQADILIKLSARWERGSDEMVCGAGVGRRLCCRELYAGIHREK